MGHMSDPYSGRRDRIRVEIEVEQICLFDAELFRPRSLLWLISEVNELNLRSSNCSKDFQHLHVIFKATTRGVCADFVVFLV